MKKVILTAAFAAMLFSQNVMAQQPAGSPDGGISAAMLEEISSSYAGDADSFVISIASIAAAA